MNIIVRLVTAAAAAALLVSPLKAQLSPALDSLQGAAGVSLSDTEIPAAGEPYSAAVPLELRGEALFSYLHRHGGLPRREKTVIGYSEAKAYMYSTVDNVGCNGGPGIITFYSQVCVSGSSGNGSHYPERGDMNGDGYRDNSMNAEHIWPQGYFNSAYPMKADLHHLAIRRLPVAHKPVDEPMLRPQFIQALRLDARLLDPKEALGRPVEHTDPAIGIEGDDPVHRCVQNRLGHLRPGAISQAEIHQFFRLSERVLHRLPARLDEDALHSLLVHHGGHAGACAHDHVVTLPGGLADLCPQVRDVPVQQGGELQAQHLAQVAEVVGPALQVVIGKGDAPPHLTGLVERVHHVEGGNVDHNHGNAQHLAHHHRRRSPTDDQLKPLGLPAAEGLDRDLQHLGGLSDANANVDPGATFVHTCEYAADGLWMSRYVPPGYYNPKTCASPGS